MTHFLMGVFWGLVEVWEVVSDPEKIDVRNRNIGILIFRGLDK